MKIIIEEYQYDAADIVDILHGLDALENVDRKICINYVGYYYNPHIHDCVFILPKVLMDEKDLVFGHLAPEKILNPDETTELSHEEINFIYEFSVWIYRAISVYHNDHKDSGIVYHKQIMEMDSVKKCLSKTFLDVLLSIIRFNRENQDFFMFTMKNIHSGFNKINWSRTITNSQTIIQSEVPVYINPVNKKRQINFDEELIVIFFSILNYINTTYGFPVTITIGFELIKGKRFIQYIKGYGKIRLKQIKYKYFSDKALIIWDLCYAFFDKAHQIRINSEQREYLLAKNFNIIFEAIIDELVGDKNIPAGLKEQYDGKRVDHIYKYQGLIENQDKSIYYIGDSKYYKLGNQITKESVYKQYTYARNVIQWNLDLFLDGKNGDTDIKYRDDETEGYNIIPNFFISAKMDKDLSYSDKIYQSENCNKSFISKQFENRLYDRDTLLIFHYDVNFLFVISLYSRNNVSQKSAWRNKVREMFRREIQDMLNEKYSFYAMRPRIGVDTELYVKKNFKQLLGRLYAPFSDDETLSLALDNTDPEHNNESLIQKLRESFYVEKCELGKNPDAILPDTKQFGYLKNMAEENVLIGYFSDSDHLKWILEHKFYNVRAGDTNGSLSIDGATATVKYLLLHNKKKQYLLPLEGKDIKIWTKQNLKDNNYPKEPSQDIYLMFKISDDELNSNLASIKCDLEKIDDFVGNTKGKPRIMTMAELFKCV